MFSPYPSHFLSFLICHKYHPSSESLNITCIPHWAHDVVATFNQRQFTPAPPPRVLSLGASGVRRLINVNSLTLIQRRNNVVCPVGIISLCLPFLKQSVEIKQIRQYLPAIFFLNVGSGVHLKNVFVGNTTLSAMKIISNLQNHMEPALSCKAKRQYLLTSQLSRYCLLT